MTWYPFSVIQKKWGQYCIALNMTAPIRWDGALTWYQYLVVRGGGVVSIGHCLLWSFALHRVAQGYNIQIFRKMSATPLFSKISSVLNQRWEAVVA